MQACEPATKKLIPCKEKSVNWDTTSNIYIEGDNLEVLKLLQKEYLGKVGMIYIDPPYNTGHKFIYNDKFMFTYQDLMNMYNMSEKEAKEIIKNPFPYFFEEWVEMYGITDQPTDKGETKTPKQQFNARVRHALSDSAWCTFMFPRLIQAWNLLSEDGLIFISIDDNELSSLDVMCNELFGDCNKVGTIVRRTKTGGGIGNKHGMNVCHDYCLVYAKNLEKYKKTSSN